MNSNFLLPNVSPSFLNFLFCLSVVSLGWIQLHYLSVYQDVARDIHTSPATFTVGRIVNNFRARTALIVSRIEDSDDVLQKTFDDSDPDEEMPSNGVVASDDNELVFRFKTLESCYCNDLLNSIK